MALTPAHFRGLVDEETRRLTNMCRYWESVTASEADISEEAQGYIRSATGQAKLLMTERFAQFTGLIHVCENNLGEKKTTSEDLQGFWDMVYFQVEDVNKKFDQLTKMQENAWELGQQADADKANMPRVGLKTNNVNLPFPLQMKTTKPVSRKCLPTETQKARIAASRKRLAEAKARMATTATAQAFAGAADKENAVLFEAPNFFLVSSPARPKQNKPRCPQGTPRSLQKTPNRKDFSPLMHVTRSAKKALLQHN
ncbi:disks large-associated protein 5-like isoform X1 [Dermacentor silvarum]|uniref:disks large-associated protein 5-like isoform X1 n=1 Tax=Dermacentor silvarum TaxID=543639 RepID=UPI002100FC5A|nr:disks large-associated protein 5-like isoform X1 [Dermacentor silvarum]